MKVPIPRRMKHLPLDPRGYPVPVNVFRDSQGRPHFTINDEEVRQRQIAARQCPICGRRLKPPLWFVGGPRSAFSERGAYIDLPMHTECAHYALQVCPYLAAPRYAGRIDDRTLDRNDPTPMMVDNTMDPNRPVVFVAVAAKEMLVLRDGRYVAPKRPYLATEYWQHGKRLDAEAAMKMITSTEEKP